MPGKYFNKKSTKVNKKPTKKQQQKHDYVKLKGNLLKDIAYLKKQVKRDKPEVKFIQSTPSSDLVGQVDGNGGGASGFFITNSVGAGVGAYSARVGEEIRLIGVNVRIQFQQQSANNLPTRYKVDIFRYSDPTASLSTVINRCYEADTISQVVDWNSTRNQLYESDYKKIASASVYLPGDQIASTNMIKDVKLFAKQNILLKYNGSATADAVNYQYACIIRSNSGNKSTSVASTNPLVSQTAVNTGAKYTHYYKNYFTDA